MRNERIHAVKTTVEANGTTTEATETTVVAETTTVAIKTTVAAETTTEAIETTVAAETTTEAIETTEAAETITVAIETTVAAETITVETSVRTIGPAPNATTPILPSETLAIAVKHHAQVAAVVDNAVAETITEATETTVVVETTTEAIETTVVVETTTEATETIVVVGMASVARLPITIGPVLNATIRTSRSATSAIGVKSLAQAVEAVDNGETIPEAVFVNKAVSETTEGPATDGAKGVHRVGEEGLDSRTDARPIPPSEDQRGSVRATPTTNLQKISEIHLVNLNGKTTERM